MAVEGTVTPSGRGAPYQIAASRKGEGNYDPKVLVAAPLQALDDVLRRVQGEYIEMPGLRLTTAQAQRLWGLDRGACDALLGALVDAKFLFRTRDGAFVRSDVVRTGRS
jgi:hypothetical protein